MVLVGATPGCFDQDTRTAAPVLAYYDVKREVTIQCDASQSGLGAVLLQKGRSVCYSSRALTTTEENYAQVEKELAIVFSCEIFDQYVYGRHHNCPIRPKIAGDNHKEIDD